MKRARRSEHSDGLLRHLKDYSGGGALQHAFATTRKRKTKTKSKTRRTPRRQVWTGALKVLPIPSLFMLFADCITLLLMIILFIFPDACPLLALIQAESQEA